MNKTRPILKISFSTFAALTGVLVIAAYIVFGGSLQAKPSKRKLKRKGIVFYLVFVYRFFNNWHLLPINFRTKENIELFTLKTFSS